jgi:protein phosphatase
VAEQSGAQPKPIHVSVFGVTDLGRVRKNNEDNFVICDLTSGEVWVTPPECQQEIGPRGALFMVADGMGGEASGEVASQICATTVPRRLYENLKSVENVGPTGFVLYLRESIEFANRIIFQSAQANTKYRGMGTTTTAATIFGPYLFVGQVGDSRAYLIRDKQILQLTRDQTFLNYLQEIGAELPVEPEKDSRKSILTQAVGTSETLDVKVTYAAVREGDLLLVCSDGLYNMAKSRDLVNILSANSPLAEKCKILVAKANEQGGTDNITVILAKFAGSGLPPTDPAAELDYKEFREEDFEAAP